jgi:siroheme synthase (precorrin-2 oxidase/ferrochelatase)
MEFDETLNKKTMKAYVWAWADGEGNYINQAESLREILEQILEYYFDDESDYKIEEIDRKFLIDVAIDDQSLKYEINIEPDALCEFLNELAELVDRPDKFDISSTSN